MHGVFLNANWILVKSDQELSFKWVRVSRELIDIFQKQHFSLIYITDMVTIGNIGTICYNTTI